MSTCISKSIPEMSVRRSHEIATEVRAAIKRDLPWVADVLVHVEPSPLLHQRSRPQVLAQPSGMENKEIARLLQETADLMEVAGEDGFRIRSYRNGAAAIVGHPERIADIVCNPERKVTDIPGIGKGLALVIDEICQRGSFDRRDQMLAKYPASALELLKIQGLGPKSISLLYEHHGVRNVDDLERICREHKLRDLPRMGAKVEEKVLRSIEAYRKSAGRYLLSFANSVAHELAAEFRALTESNR